LDIFKKSELLKDFRSITINSIYYLFLNSPFVIQLFLILFQIIDELFSSMNMVVDLISDQYLDLSTGFCKF